MINAKRLRKSYNALYGCLRNYIWDVNTVKVIAELEVECYKTFPDVSSAKRSIGKIKLECRQLLPDDEDLNKAITDFEGITSGSLDIYSKIHIAKETE